MALTMLFLSVLNMSLTAGIVILAVCIARLILKNAPKIYSYALWGLVLFRLLCPVSIFSSFSVIPDPITSGEVLSQWSDDYIGEVKIHHDGNIAYEAAVEAGREPIYADEGHFYVVTGSDGISAPKTIENTIMPILSKIWIAGIVALVLHSIVSYLQVRKKTKAAVLFRKGIYIADDIGMPFVMGIMRPRIYLPRSLEHWERTFIIAHERHHIRRGDHIFKALSYFALMVHWFNPLVWLSFILASRDMEMSCDEAVIRRMGEDVRADYSASLLNLAIGQRLFTGMPLAFGEGDPTGRVRNLAKWKKPAFWVMLVCVLLCLALTACLLTNPESSSPIELPQENAKTVKLVLHNDPLPDGYFESRDGDGNIIFTDGIQTVGGVFCYGIPKGLYDPKEDLETLLYKMGIPDYMDSSLYFRGGMTYGDHGWLAEFESNVPEGEEPTVYRRHHFSVVEDVVYDVWFDRRLLDYETTEQIRVCVHLPDGKPAELLEWNVSIRPDHVSRTGATALFVYSGSIPGEEGAELTYGDFLSLERMENGSWVSVEELPGFHYFVGDASYPVTDGYGMVHEWPDRFGELPDGHYRLGKRVTLVRSDGSRESRMVYGEFMLPDSVRTGLIPLNELPESYSAEQAMIDGCFVQVDGAARENLDLFQNFAANSWDGIPGMIRIVNWHYGDDSSWYAMDLSFDGAKYTIKSQYSIDGKDTYTFQHLKHFEGVFDELSAYSYFVLTNDAALTLEEAENGDHWTVYSHFTYAPKKPKLPTNPAQAVLEFNDAPLVTVTDFDRLEKIWILFQDAEFMGYEPKTHSVGVGLNLILTSQNGETVTIELDPDSDICRINAEYVFYGAYDEPDYIEKLWYYLGIPSWPDSVYEKYPNAYRP